MLHCKKMLAFGNDLRDNTLMLHRSKASGWPASRCGPLRRKPMAAEKVTKLAADSAAQAKKVMDEGAAQARKFIEDGTVQARAAVEKGMEQATKTAEGMFKSAEEAVEFNRGTMEIYAKATQTYMVGMQDLGRQSFALMQGLTDHALEGAKALASVKSLKEAADIQSSYGKAALDRAMSETTKLNEAAFKLFEQAASPLAARAQLAVEKFAKPIAA
jgi:hypothetical protein